MASPVGSDDWLRPGGGEAEDELNETDSTIAAICAIDHYDWLAVITALATGGPGTSASSADLAGYVRDYDPDSAERSEDDHDEDDYDLALNLERYITGGATLALCRTEFDAVVPQRG